jgi:hypothetical protein
MFQAELAYNAPKRFLIRHGSVLIQVFADSFVFFAWGGTVKMYRDKVEFQNRLYNLRLIDFGEDWGKYFVASTQLLNKLWDDESGYTCEEAVGVDELIFYFVPTHYFRFPDSKLKSVILSEIG